MALAKRSEGKPSQRIDKKNPAKIGRELINQGASTNLISASTAPSSGQFRKIWGNLCRKLVGVSEAIRRKALAEDRAKKKLPTKIGGELINQGASTNLISGSTAPHSGQFEKFGEFVAKVRSTKKNPAKIGRELINQGASTN